MKRKLPKPSPLEMAHAVETTADMADHEEGGAP